MLANRYINKKEDNYIIVNDVRAGYIATEYLIKNRFKKIIYINGFKHISPAIDRQKGYLKALKKYNLTVEKNQIYCNCMTYIDGYNIMKNIPLYHNPPFYFMFWRLCYFWSYY